MDVRLRLHAGGPKFPNPQSTTTSGRPLPMAPPQRLRAELNEDVTAEILLRIPPDEPAHLIRASAVCKLWLRVVTDRAFLRLYRAFHRGAPLLGFFHSHDSAGPPFPGFIPATAASSPPQLGHGEGSRVPDPDCLRRVSRWVSDCRHGRVLISDIGRRRFVVWDPLSNQSEELQAPSSWYTFHSNAVVLCATAGCHHRSCRGGPFYVLCLRVDSSDCTIVHAHVYSSESRAWYSPASGRLDGLNCCFDMRRAAVVGDGIYCFLQYGRYILKYDLVKHRFCLLGVPNLYKKDVPVLMQNEDGSLGIADVLGSTLDLWSTMVNEQGPTEWVLRRVIKLEEILPVDVIAHQANVISFAEGVEVFFISTNAGVFTFELKSGLVRKVGSQSVYGGIIPFISFFTPDGVCSKWT